MNKARYTLVLNLSIRYWCPPSRCHEAIKTAPRTAVAWATATMTPAPATAPPVTGERTVVLLASDLAGGWDRTIEMRDGINILNGLIADVQVRIIFGRSCDLVVFTDACFIIRDYLITYSMSYAHINAFF